MALADGDFGDVPDEENDFDPREFERDLGEFFAIRDGMEIRGEIDATENRAFKERHGFGHLGEEREE